MKLGTILKGAFVAGVITGAVGLAVVATTATGTTKVVQKLWTKYRPKKEEAPHG